MGLEKFRKKWQAKKAELEKAVKENPTEENKLALQKFLDANKPNISIVEIEMRKFMRERSGIPVDPDFFLNPCYATIDDE